MTPDRELLLALAATMLHHPNFRHHLSEEQQAALLNCAGIAEDDNIVAVLFERFFRAATQNE